MSLLKFPKPHKNARLILKFVMNRTFGAFECNFQASSSQISNHSLQDLLRSVHSKNCKIDKRCNVILEKLNLGSFEWIALNNSEKHLIYGAE